MEIKQRGVAQLTAIAVVVAASAFAGLWSFYHFKVNGLESEIIEKQAVIDTMAKEKAECLAQKTGLQTANKSFAAQVAEQNEAVAGIKRERNAKAAEAAAARQEADKQSLEFKKRIADILNSTVKVGDDWCGTWSKMITDYTTMRQAK